MIIIIIIIIIMIIIHLDYYAKSQCSYTGARLLSYSSIKKN